MLALIFATLPACGVSLHTHAVADESAANLIDAVGQTLKSECNADYAALVEQYDGAELAQQRAITVAYCQSLRADLNAVTAAWKAYHDTVKLAHERGDSTLVQKPARELVDVWGKLQRVAQSLGLEVDGPPGALTELAGGAP